MKKLKIHQVDAFTTKLFGGNPTAVVRDAHVLSDDEIGEVLGRDTALHRICEALIQGANDGGGPDNVTAVVLQVDAV